MPFSTEIPTAESARDVSARGRGQVPQIATPVRGDLVDSDAEHLLRGDVDRTAMEHLTVEATDRRIVVDLAEHPRHHPRALVRRTQPWTRCREHLIGRKVARRTVLAYAGEHPRRTTRRAQRVVDHR